MKRRSMPAVGFRVFGKEEGPLPLNKGVLNACDLSPYTKAENLTKIDPKVDAFLKQKRDMSGQDVPLF